MLDLDVYMDVLYIVCVIYRFYNSSCADYIVFRKKIYSTCLSTTADKEANLLRPTQP
jgi:hypothetical protein